MNTLTILFCRGFYHSLSTFLLLRKLKNLKTWQTSAQHSFFRFIGIWRRGQCCIHHERQIQQRPHLSPKKRCKGNVFDCLYNANFTSEDDTRQAKKHKGKWQGVHLNKRHYSNSLYLKAVIYTRNLKFLVTPSIGENFQSNDMAPSPLRHKHFNTDYARIRKKCFYFLRLRLQK